MVERKDKGKPEEPSWWDFPASKVLDKKIALLAHFLLSVVGCWDSFFQYKSPSHRVLVQEKPAEPSHRKRKDSAPNERIQKEIEVLSNPKALGLIS